MCCLAGPTRLLTSFSIFSEITPHETVKGKNVKLIHPFRRRRDVATSLPTHKIVRLGKRGRAAPSRDSLAAGTGESAGLFAAAWCCWCCDTEHSLSSSVFSLSANSRPNSRCVSSRSLQHLHVGNQMVSWVSCVEPTRYCKGFTRAYR